MLIINSQIYQNKSVREMVVWVGLGWPQSLADRGCLGAPAILPPTKRSPSRTEDYHNFSNVTEWSIIIDVKDKISENLSFSLLYQGMLFLPSPLRICLTFCPTTAQLFRAWVWGAEVYRCLDYPDWEFLLTSYVVRLTHYFEEKLKLSGKFITTWSLLSSREVLVPVRMYNS